MRHCVPARHHVPYTWSISVLISFLYGGGVLLLEGLKPAAKARL